MKSDHRHELKTNELADWLANFPQWMEQNRTNLIAAAAVVVVAILVYFGIYYRGSVVSVRNQQRLTRLVSQVPEQMNTVMRSAMQGTDQSYTLMPISQDLQDFAAGVSNDDMAALALIKRGETLRAELHLRLADVPREDLTAQIAKAQASYQQALDRKPSSPTLAAAARFGLGLCEEELGNFDKAAEIYRDVAQKPEYAGTAAQAAAEYRVKIMDDFKTQVAFKPAPAQPQAATPTIQIPGAAGSPTVIQSPGTPVIGPELPPADAPATPPVVGDANKPAGG
ncbi:MAG: tetratricopeptide repeat protein [Phycisphaerales bacterium]